MANYYNYESVTKALYTFENLIELLKLNHGREVKVYHEDNNSGQINNLEIFEKDEIITINGISINKNDIYDVVSGTHFGNWMIIKIDISNGYNILNIVIHDKDKEGKNASFNPTEYWNKVVSDYNS